MRAALAEPSLTSFTSRASSGGSADSRHSLSGDLPSAVDPGAGRPAAQGPSAAAVAAVLLQRHHRGSAGSGVGELQLPSAGPPSARSTIAAAFGAPLSRGQSSASMEVELGPEFVGLAGRLPLRTLSDEQEGPGSGASSLAGGAGCAGASTRQGSEGSQQYEEEDKGADMGGAMGSPLSSGASYSSGSEQGSSAGTRLEGEDDDDEEVDMAELLGPSGEDPFAEFDHPPDPETFRATLSATTSPEKSVALLRAPLSPPP